MTLKSEVIKKVKDVPDNLSQDLNNITAKISGIETKAETVFDTATNGRALIANAIGSPAVATNSHTQLANNIDNITSKFRTKLTEKGVTGLDGKKYNDLVDNIDIIKTSNIPDWAKSVVAIEIPHIFDKLKTRSKNITFEANNIFYLIYQQTTYIFDSINNILKSEDNSFSGIHHANLSCKIDNDTIFILETAKLATIFNLKTKIKNDIQIPSEYYSIISGCGCTYYNDYIYFTNMNSFFKYNITTKTWKSINVTSNTIRKNPALLIENDILYCFSTDTIAFDLKLETKRVLCVFPISISSEQCLNAFVVDNTIKVVRFTGSPFPIYYTYSIKNNEFIKYDNVKYRNLDENVNNSCASNGKYVLMQYNCAYQHTMFCHADILYFIN